MIVASKLKPLPSMTGRIMIRPIRSGAPTRVAKAIRYRRSDAVLLAESGKVYGTFVRSPTIYALEEMSFDLLDTLRKVGALSGPEIDKALGDADARRDRAEAKRQATKLADAADALGVPLSAAQRKAIKAAGGDP